VYRLGNLGALIRFCRFFCGDPVTFGPEAICPFERLRLTAS